MGNFLNIRPESLRKYYSTWEISLYAGNNPEWLLQHKPELLNFIQYQIGYTYIEDIKVNVSNKN